MKNSPPWPPVCGWRTNYERRHHRPTFRYRCQPWVFVKFQNKTGYGDNKTAVIGAGVVFVVIFFIIFSLAEMILPS